MKTTATIQTIAKPKIVYTTRDYSKFKHLKGNRPLRERHIKKMVASMEKDFLSTIITVNEYYECVDGQHRLAASEILKKPVQFIIEKGYGLKQAQILNRNNSEWDWKDHMDSFVEQGHKDYMKYKKFKALYNLGHRENLVLLSGRNGCFEHSFKEGLLDISSWDNACAFADKVMEIKKIYKGAKRRSFVNALLKVQEIKAFDIDSFIHKLSVRPALMVDCGKTDLYIDVIEKIYNYNRGKNKKISLRYS